MDTSPMLRISMAVRLGARSMISLPCPTVRRRLSAAEAAIRSAASATLIAASLLVPGLARGEISCPPGQFISSHDDKCGTVSPASRLPMDDKEPMVFEVVHDGPRLTLLQATGTIRPDTPDQFAKFLKSDEAKILAASGNAMNLHSPGGSPAAGI